MKTDNPFRKTRVTSQARVLFAHLEHPDTRFGSPGYYKVTLALGVAEAEKMEKGLKSLRKAAATDLNALAEKHGKRGDFKGTDIKTPIFKDGTAEEGDRSGLPAGTPFREVTFKVPATSTRAGREVSNKPQVVDAKKRPVSSPVFGGSDVKVAYRVAPYSGFGGGVTLRLQGVQVLNLVTGGGFDPTAAFDEEDGFEEPEGFEGGTPPARGDDDPGDGSVDF